MASLRLFIAIEIPPGIKSQIVDIMSELQSTEAGVRWERPEKLHITLKFLGDTPEELLPQIVLLLEGVAEKTSPFTIKYSGLGCFPNMNEPRIVWVGVDDTAGRLQPLVASIETEMASIGFEKEAKQFHPHVTIGRTKNRKITSALLRTMQSITLDSQPATIKDIVLIKSELGPGGSKHSSIRAFRLSAIM